MLCTEENNIYISIYYLASINGLYIVYRDTLDYIHNIRKWELGEVKVPNETPYLASQF